MLDNPEQAIDVLEWLRGAGAEIELDEFAVGYSSFAYLERLPFDAVKLDPVMIQAGREDAKGSDSALLRSVVALARELGKEIVAKGVETQGDMSYLRSIGCEFASAPTAGSRSPNTT